ncbi:MAG TPA: alanine racemase [Oscillospiraceae bacterium]|nr:alanine racemase [Oscillospiraceae bacterium]
MYYRTYAKISLSAIKHNVNAIRKSIDKDTKIMAVVKADAYGHGANEVAPILEEEVDYLAVAALEEGIDLRKSGAKKPILILSYTSPEQYHELFRHNISQTIYDLENAKLLSSAALKEGKTAKVHIKVDTGMSRIGFADTKESAAAVKEICRLKGLFVEGIFTHFARADEEYENFSKIQVQRFEKFISLLEKDGINIPIKHACNSAGTLTVDKKFNMIRIGMLLYGMYPDKRLKKSGLNLLPAMTILSHVADVHTIEKGVGVSYSHDYKTKKKIKAATVCIGYADGYSRALSNKGRVIINGKYASVIGRVCMDLMVVDITDIPNVKIGDTVTVLGKEGDIEVTADEIAEKSGTINYEIICSFKNRVKRIYEK